MAGMASMETATAPTLEGFVSRIEALLGARNAEEASRLVEAAAGAHPALHEIGLAALAQFRADAPAFLMHASAAAELVPGDPLALEYRAWARLATGDRDGAEADARAACV